MVAKKRNRAAVLKPNQLSNPSIDNLPANPLLSALFGLIEDKAELHSRCASPSGQPIHNPLSGLQSLPPFGGQFCCQTQGGGGGRKSSFSFLPLSASPAPSLPFLHPPSPFSPFPPPPSFKKEGHRPCSSRCFPRFLWLPPQGMQPHLGESAVRFFWLLVSCSSAASVGPALVGTLKLCLGTELAFA